MTRALKALFSWLVPAQTFTPSGADWVIALRRAGYRASFVRLPASCVRAVACKSWAGY